jgi:uncharacterized protein (DUF1501 family)
MAGSRRDFMGVALRGVGGLLAADLLLPRLARAADAAPAAPRARAVISLWLNGGPSHLDTFDPKPGTAVGGPFKTIATRAAGVAICEHLPFTAEVMDRIALVRGLSTREGNHQRAQYLLHTGYAPNPTVVHPSFGAWVSEELPGPALDIPAFVSIGGPSAGPGFLGAQHGPFVVRGADEPPRDVGYARDVDQARFDRRLEALRQGEAAFAARTADPRVVARRAVFEKAVRMMRSPRLDAFDISAESDATRGLYGASPFGHGCLMARRLVEAGARYVEVVLDGWDTHQNNFERVKTLCGTLDPALSGLVKDLEAHRLLGSTLVVCQGEFGRTPAVNPNDGRDHHPAASFCVLAGGGIKGGVVHGATDTEGRNAVGTPVTVPNLHATLATALGMDPLKDRVSPLGRPISVTDNGTAIAALLP